VVHVARDLVSLQTEINYLDNLLTWYKGLVSIMIEIMDLNCLLAQDSFLKGVISEIRNSDFLFDKFGDLE
jgi:hypothetical protein